MENSIYSQPPAVRDEISKLAKANGEISVLTEKIESKVTEYQHDGPDTERNDGWRPVKVVFCPPAYTESAVFGHGIWCRSARKVSSQKYLQLADTKT